MAKIIRLTDNDTGEYIYPVTKFDAVEGYTRTLNNVEFISISGNNGTLTTEQEQILNRSEANFIMCDEVYYYLSGLNEYKSFNNDTIKIDNAEWTKYYGHYDLLGTETTISVGEHTKYIKYNNKIYYLDQIGINPSSFDDLVAGSTYHFSCYSSLPSGTNGIINMVQWSNVETSVTPSYTSQDFPGVRSITFNGTSGTIFIQYYLGESTTPAPYPYALYSNFLGQFDFVLDSRPSGLTPILNYITIPNSYKFTSMDGKYITVINGVYNVDNA